MCDQTTARTSDVERLRMSLLDAIAFYRNGVELWHDRDSLREYNQAKLDALRQVLQEVNVIWHDR